MGMTKYAVDPKTLTKEAEGVKEPRLKPEADEKPKPKPKKNPA